MWPHIISSESQANLQVLVPKYLLLVAKNGIRKAGMKGADQPESRLGRRNQAHIERIVGVDKPYKLSAVSKRN